jgi:hypothetical protein
MPPSRIKVSKRHGDGRQRWIASPDSVWGSSGPTPKFVRDVSNGFSIADHCCGRDPDGTKVGTPRAGTSGTTATIQRRRNELYGGAVDKFTGHWSALMHSW